MFCFATKMLNEFSVSFSIHPRFPATHINKMSICSNVIFKNPGWHYFRIIPGDLKIVTMIILITIIAGVLAMTPVALYIVRRVQSSRMRRKIAAEGFETATDVLYPRKRRLFRQYKIGPVIPQ